MVVATTVVVAGAVEAPSGGAVVESASDEETTVGSLDSAGVMVAAVLVVGRMVIFAEALLTSLGETDVLDSGVAELNSALKGSCPVVEMEPDTVAMEAVGVMTPFAGVVSSVTEEPGLVESEVTGMVVAVPGTLTLAIVVAPEADGVVSRLAEDAAIPAAIGIVVAMQQLLQQWSQTWCLSLKLWSQLKGLWHQWMQLWHLHLEWWQLQWLCHWLFQW